MGRWAGDASMARLGCDWLSKDFYPPWIHAFLWSSQPQCGSSLRVHVSACLSPVNSAEEMTMASGGRPLALSRLQWSAERNPH